MVELTTRAEIALVDISGAEYFPVREDAAPGALKLTLARLRNWLFGSATKLINMSGATDGQVLKYDAASSTFLPATPVAGGTSTTATGIWAGTSDAEFISPKDFFDAAVPQAFPAASAGVITLDFGAGINFLGTLAANVTIANPTNAKPGQSGTIIITQDATGSRVVSWGNKFRFPGGAAVGGLLSTPANSIDLVSYFVRLDGTILCGIGKAFAA